MRRAATLLATAVTFGAATCGAVIAGIGTSAAAPSSGKDGLRAVGLTSDGDLVRFRTSDTDKDRKALPVTGLALDTTLVGIDYRIQDRKLYGVGDAGGVYQLTPKGAATKVSQLTVPLEGASFGVDFNPAADRLRVISDTGQNLRHDINPAGVTITDTPLSYPPAPAAATGVTGAAYTNNDLDAGTSTSLFDIDGALDQVVLQSPANSGQLAATGKLGIDVDPAVGFDIHSPLDDAGATKGNKAFATFQVGGESGLYRVSLLTGKATELGSFADDLVVTDIAIRIDQ